MSSTPPSPSTTTNHNKIPQIETEIISEEEMALIEAAFAFAAAARPAVPLVQLHGNARSVRNITLLSKRRLSVCTGSVSGDIEDSGRVAGSGGKNRSSVMKKSKVEMEPFMRLRKGKGLSVTKMTGSEWCEKQMEFELSKGKPKRTAAMKAGSARHKALEEEVIKRVKIRVQSAEDMWALKLINFIIGINQLQFDGLTRELPLVAFAEGVWMVGIIDEIRMPLSDPERIPILVDTKTRVQATVPSEPQRRNGRLQLMCYKYLWDRLVADRFPSQKFFDFFSLNPNQILSNEIRESTDRSGFPSQTLNDLVHYFGNSCSLLPQAHDKLLLRYELQEDESLLGEDEFAYDPDWLKGQMKSLLEFWKGEREASYPPLEERWKCRRCHFVSECPATSNTEVSLSETKKEDVISPEMAP